MRMLDNAKFSFMNEQRELTRFEAFLLLVLAADSRGYVSLSIRQIQQQFRWKSTSKVHKFIKDLSDQKVIEHTDQIRIVAYHHYLGDVVTQNDSQIAVEVNAHFKRETGKKTTMNEKRSRMIVSRMKEHKLTVEDMKLIITHKSNQWKKDDNMSKYLTYETLFANKHIIKYLDEARNSSNGRTISDKRRIHQ